MIEIGILINHNRGLRRGFAAERGAPLPPWPWPAASRRTALNAALVAGLSVLAPKDGGAAAAAEAGTYEDARSGFAVALPVRLSVFLHVVAPPRMPSRPDR